MANPTLLMRPGFSRDTAGTVTPGTTGTVNVVGDDWQIATSSSVTQTVSGTHLSSVKGTLALWFQPGHGNFYGLTAFAEIVKAQATSNHLAIYRSNAAGGPLTSRLAAGTQTWSHGKAASNADWVMLTLEWSTALNYWRFHGDNVQRGTAAYVSPNVGTSVILGGAEAVNISALMLFDDVLTSDERTLLFATQNWTWDVLTPPAPVVAEESPIDRRAAKIAALQAMGLI